MLAGKRLDGWTAVLLASTVAASVTGFLFVPFERLLPSHALCVISLVVRAIAIVARCPLGLSGAWR